MNIKEELTFEKALAELEKMVEKLESGELSLADSLETFERGVKLTSFCSNKLQEAEDKIEIIKEEKGQITIEDYNYQGKGEE